MKPARRRGGEEASSLASSFASDSSTRAKQVRLLARYFILQSSEKEIEREALTN